MSVGKLLEILIMRHGQSEADLLGVHEGRADFPLTKHGEWQAKKMAGYVATQFSRYNINKSIKKSKRHYLVAQGEIGCEMIEEKDLMEFINGVLAGLSREEAAVKYPLPPNGRHSHVQIENGESELEFRFRAERVFQKNIYDYRDFKQWQLSLMAG